MNREIKFRGLSIDGKRWIYGMPTYDFKYVFYSDNLGSPDNYEVIIKTVSQFTGLKDKNGVDIYEGDKVVCTLNDDSSQKEIEAVVEWHNHAWRLNRIWLLTDSIWLLNQVRTIKVVGNIHESQAV